MSLRHIMIPRVCLAFGAALIVAAVLLTHRGGPARLPEGDGVVFVYFPSLCQAPGDSSNCREISHAARPGFESMAACSAYADVQLRRENNPRLMASCLRQREG
jgi:hypothetical protein